MQFSGFWSVDNKKAIFPQALFHDKCQGAVCYSVYKPSPSFPTTNRSFQLHSQLLGNAKNLSIAFVKKVPFSTKWATECNRLHTKPFLSFLPAIVGRTEPQTHIQYKQRNASHQPFIILSDLSFVQPSHSHSVLNPQKPSDIQMTRASPVPLQT